MIILFVITFIWLIKLSSNYYMLKLAFNEMCRIMKESKQITLQMLERLQEEVEKESNK